MAEFVKLYTAQGENLSGIPHNVYPRPQLKRDSFFCLNGEWDFAVTKGEEPTEYNRKILVPFPPQSLLSKINEVYKKGDILFYKTSFKLPDNFIKDRVLLHIGAADQIADVSLNGATIGRHEGGYHNFSFDITDNLRESNTLVIKITDDPKSTALPYGKQKAKRGGMWYTPVSGIWQTVWLESVPKDYIKSIKIDVNNYKAVIRADGAMCGVLTVNTPDGEISAELKDGIAEIAPESPRLWSPEDPYLYYFSIKTESDCVKSYFALRTLSVKDIDGIPRLCLNGKPYFFHGLLDQGYYSDGIYTPATPQNYTEDILRMKALGFNTLRKHIKIEPEQFYYDCDRLGMIVFQDMVNNGSYSFIRDTALPTVGLKRLPDRWLHPSRRTRNAFIKGMEQTVAALYNHPCICLWTIFNEGWGQFCGNDMYRHMRNLDSSRFIDTASGWFCTRESDVISPHIYFKPVRIAAGSKPILLSEFGGYSFQPKGHIFNTEKEYGYRSFSSREEFAQALIALYENEVIPAVKKGLCGAVYTQVSDVEDETNGLLSYDRKVEKVSPKEMLPIAKQLYEEIK